jgi:flagellin-specific chaperone FliS
MEANMRKSVEPIQTVARLLGEIREAWVEMLEKESQDAVGLTHFSGTA